MLALVLHALRARRAQSLTIFALTLLAGLGAAAAPWFLIWGSDAVARATLAAAPASERVVVASGSQRYAPGAPSPVQFIREQIAEHLVVPGARTQVGARVLASFGGSAATGRISAYLVFREEVCQHLNIVEGACPGDGAVISRSAARRLGLAVGDPLSVEAASRRTTLAVSGVYEVSDPYESYWAGTKLLAVLGETGTGDPAFVSEQTLLGLPLSGLDVDAHVELPDSVFTDRNFNLAGTLSQAAAELHQQRIDVTSGVTALRRRVFDHWSLLVLGVSVTAVQLVLVCWVGLFLAVRHTSDDRRADVALLKLRGVSTARAWLLMTLRSGLPALAGTLAGIAAGFATAAAFARGAGGSTSVGLFDAIPVSNLSTLDVLGLSLAAAVVAELGLVAAVVAEWRALRLPALDLLRRVPARQRGWRADVAELVVVALAGACVYQARAEAGTGVAASVLALLAPCLVAIAVALIVARALPPLAARAGARALRTGRAGVALAALHLARRPGTHRVFAVLAVAAAVFTTTTTVWHSASAAWRQRAVVELGAGRVLSVDAPGPAGLMAAVRAVDPEGRYAMAVAGRLGHLPEDRILAVDSTRLARVGQFPDGGLSAAQVAALLRPPAPEPPQVVDGPATLDVAGPAGTAVRLHLSTMDGIDRPVEFPLAPAGRASVEATVSGCAAGCRLAALEVVTVPGAATQPDAPATVEIYGLSQGATTVLSGQMLGDVSRWRTMLGYPAQAPEFSPRDGRLEITGLGGLVSPLTSPVPLPVVLAGAPPERHGAENRGAVLEGLPVPLRVAANVAVLPQVGDGGMYVDLEYALRSNDEPSGAQSLWVWLTADAPPSLVAALADHGVSVRSEVSAAGRTGELTRDSPGLALLFGYLVAVVLLLLGAGVAFISSTVESSGRVAELVALRAQGLPARSVRWVGLGGPVVLVAGATATGVLAALLAQVLVTAQLPVFSDDWALLPTPAGLTPVTVGVSAAVVAVLLGAASVSGAVALVAAVRARADRGRA